MTDESTKLLLNEIKQLHKQLIDNIFSELTTMAKANPHFFGKTTYQIDMSLSDWYAFERRYNKKEK